ncbi:HAMP domain-containing sensor histidine kinase [Alkalihalobacillus sp. TS-13]|uniref:sensor histidine kinase n=1 Tax=Alkalihalobacillus sp. TS-13 TaxID=2842455 RepID=UPI001C86C1A6|nr:HAMP domain-containing sensor histidine kinase [Alkalihalobacillus sp. TS-13]
MVEYLKDFILNIFFILSPLVFYPYVHKFKSNIVLYRIMLGFLFSLILILVMSLPIDVNGVTYDFRSIPVIIGSLYGGVPVAITLYCVLVLYRFILGNPDNLLYLMAVLPSLFIVLYSLRSYGNLRIYQKIIVAVMLCSLMKLITISLYLAYIQRFDLMFNSFIDTIQTYLVQGIIIGACVYLIEFLNRYFHMQYEVYKSEKIRMVSEMAASVAHEVRNPLTSVRGFIQLLGDTDQDKEKREYFQKICLDELDRADLIISDYLSLAKPDNEIIETINVIDEVSHISNALLTYANYNNIHINTEYPENGELSIVGDKQKFRQALINIGKNAIESMQSGGILDIKAKQLNDNVVMYIKDTGVGMSPQQIQRLGTPYYSTKEKGTGLGTMVSFTIIKKMKGKVEIMSEVGKGTDVIIIFPKMKLDE